MGGVAALSGALNGPCSKQGHFMKPLHIWMDYMVRVWSPWISRIQAAGGLAVSLLITTGSLPGSFPSHLDQGNSEGPGFSPSSALVLPQLCIPPQTTTCGSGTGRTANWTSSSMTGCGPKEPGLREK